MRVADTCLYRFSANTENMYKLWDEYNDGSGSGLDADLLDGTHKADLLTAASSSAKTNMSVTVGGTTKSVTDMYARVLS